MEVKKQNYSTWIILFPKHKTRKLKIVNKAIIKDMLKKTSALKNTCV